MSICHKCKNKLAGDDKFCVHCGTEVKQPSTAHICQKCKNELETGSKFCAKCGTEVKKTVAGVDCRNPQVAAVLNFFMPGSGYLYAGKRVALGVGLLSLMVVLFSVIIIPPNTLGFTDFFFASILSVLYFPLTLLLSTLQSSGYGILHLLLSAWLGFNFAYDVFKQTK